ncbi:hypothetical protein LGM57_33785 [Burkholderia cepacia]|uniref:hypothetical protein n=1 Tax=Burkholderia cepacia TaxID=292 RepID=UPI001CF4F1CD|nr:hypothetical protein [Burkholderia cepacia]MCA7981307.1 hypothetical protein [Burkholderia cepacia]
MLTKLAQVVERTDFVFTLLTLVVALLALAKKVNTERKAHGGGWKLTGQVSGFDVIVGVIFILVTMGRLLPAMVLPNVSVKLVLGLCVLVGAALAVRRHAHKRNRLPLDFKWDLLTLAPALICLVVLWEMVEAVRNAGGQ